MFKEINILKSSFLTLSIRFVGAFAGIALTILVTFTLSINDAGSIFLVIAILNICGRIASAGMGLSMLRFVSAYKSLKEFNIIYSILLSTLIFVIFCSVVISIILISLKFYIAEFIFENADLTIGIYIIALALPFFAVTNILIGYIQGNKKPMMAVFLENISTQIIFSFSIIVFILLNKNLSLSDAYNFLLLASIFTFVVAVFYSLFMYSKHRSSNLDFSKNKEVFYTMLPFLIFIIMQMTIQYSSQILTGYYLDSKNVSLFVVIQRIAFSVAVIMIIFNQVLAPYISSSYKNNDINKLKKISYFCTRVSVMCSIPIIIIIMLFSRDILLFFGEEYIFASSGLQILLIFQILGVFAGNSIMILNMTGNEKDTRNILTFSALAGVILGIILIPSIGIIGAAISTGFAISAQNIIAAYFVYKRFNINILNSYLLTKAK
tara:strand:+ start:2284 stop:3591 length:1308 start_codon:yes stop_codon:yes gene_type:complete